MAKIIQSRFAVKACPKCGKPIAEGASVYYDASAPRGHKAWHVACGDTPAATPAPASAPHGATPAPAMQGGGAWPARVARRVFDSVQAAVAASQVDPGGGMSSKWQSHGKDQGPSNVKIYGVPSVADAEAILASGTWSEGVKRMQDALRVIGATLRPRSIRRVRVRRDFGSEVDITEYWRGRGDVAWQHCERAARNGPQSVTLATNLSINRDKHSDVLFWRGAAVLAVADALTAAGYNVEIIALECGKNFSEDGKRDSVLEICLKSALAPLDLNALAVPACCGAFFRMTTFRLLSNYGFPVASGLGQAATYEDIGGTKADPRRMYIAEHCTNQASARKWVNDTLRAIDPESMAAAA